MGLQFFFYIFKANVNLPFGQRSKTHGHPKACEGKKHAWKKKEAHDHALLFFSMHALLTILFFSNVVFVSRGRHACKRFFSFPCMIVTLCLTKTTFLLVGAKVTMHACLSLPLCWCLTFFFQTRLLVVALPMRVVKVVKIFDKASKGKELLSFLLYARFFSKGYRRREKA